MQPTAQAVGKYRENEQRGKGDTRSCSERTSRSPTCPDGDDVADVKLIRFLMVLIP